MKKVRNFKYYDKDKFLEILELIRKCKYNEAIEKCYQYLNMYPYDISVITSLSNLLLQLGNISDAEKILNDAIITIKSRNRSFNQYIYMKMKLLACQEKWKECYLLMKENLSRIKELRKDFYFIILYLEQKLNISFGITIPNYTYTMQQVLQYDEQKALEQISKHIDKKDIGNKENSIFNENFPLEKYYFYFRNILPVVDNYPQLYYNIFHNQYIFKYEKCGTNHGKSVDYIQVITLQNSNDIITMYPTDNKGNFSYIDITPKVEECDLEYAKVKRLSQIEKFNQRYGKTLDKN